MAGQVSFTHGDPRCAEQQPGNAEHGGAREGELEAAHEKRHHYQKYHNAEHKPKALLINKGDK